MGEPSWMTGHPRKILLATDLSCRCDRALDRAVLLARQWDAQLLVLHVLDPSEDLHLRRQLDDLPSWRRPPDPLRLVEAQIRRDLDGTFENLAVQIAEGDPAGIIVDIAAREHCGLIVTGVARDQTLGRYLLGATVDRLVRRSPTPILVVKSRARRPYRKVVVATDFSDSSRHALDAAAAFFPYTDLALFHSYELPFAGFLDKPSTRDSFREAEHEASAAFLAKSTMGDDLKQRLRVLVEHGRPDALLRAYVQDSDTDLVVLGTHGRSGILDALIGGMARRILESAPRDVLLIREPRAAGPR